ncbi:hypothetical protein AcW1_009927 [Taiwanofungus camphoratus]|nr:hypothetical protein AcW1_009927 [Antrodia cinnamomea]
MCPKLRLKVFCLWIFDSLHLAFITDALYTYAVTHFADLSALKVPTWGVTVSMSLCLSFKCSYIRSEAHLLVTGLSDVTVRGVFCQRVWKLSNRSWPLVASIIMSTLVALGEHVGLFAHGNLDYHVVHHHEWEAANWAFAIRMITTKDYAEFSEFSWILYMGLSASVVADLIIATSLCVLLKRIRTGLPRTDSILRVLMLYTINTGVLTSLCAISCLVAYATMPDNYVFIAMYFVLSKLFLNSLLATLNARDHLRKMYTGGVDSISFSMATSDVVASHVAGDDKFVKIHIKATSYPTIDSVSRTQQN